MSAHQRPKNPKRLHGGHRAELDALHRKIDLLAKACDVDLAGLERLHAPDVAADLPSSWEALEALGRDPLTGEARL